ncbi:vacuolar sorting protein VPS33/slp1 [Allomyces arbusculus]|nr:vacuolar sorting protein VPS33/slp1 [Allomyces arbusculus]
MATSGFSIKETLKQRLLNDMVCKVQPATKWKIMVVDPLSMNIINHALKIYDILQENVTLVEMITKKRQPYPTLEAIYFLSSTPEAIAYFIHDFCPGGGRKPLYSSAHLFFTSVLSDTLMDTITSSGAAKYIKNLQELYVDFFPFESRVFSLNMPSSFFQLYSPAVPTSAVVQGELGVMAKRLVAALATLGDFPYVRVHRLADPAAARAGRLGRLVLTELETLAAADPNFPTVDPQNKGTLILVDRAIDINAAILHEFTYQAMAHDLLQLDDNKYMYAGEAGQDEPKEVILDETDMIWVQVRHMHIAETIDTIMAQFNKFLSENKAASSAMGNKPDGGSVSLKDMKATLAAMPQFQELKQKYSIHISMAQECMTVFEKLKLAETGAVEQDLATGETAEGERPKDVVRTMIELLDDPIVTPYDKVRLLILFIVHKDGIQESDQRKLLAHADIDPQLAESIVNLCRLGVQVTRESRRTRREPRKKKSTEPFPFELSRYTPVVKTVMEDHCANTLDVDQFPYLGPSPLPSETLARPGGTSLRSTKPSWQKRPAPGLPTAGAAAATADELPGPKLYIFVVGGMTYSEIRAAYEATAKCNREVVIASTHVITPTRFLDDLRNLRDPSAFPGLEPEFGFGPGPEPLPDLPAVPPPAPPRRPSGPITSSLSATAATAATMSSPAAGGSAAPHDKKKKKLFGLF